MLCPCHCIDMTKSITVKLKIYTSITPYFCSSIIRHKKIWVRPSVVLLRVQRSGYLPLISETGWTGELWSNTNLLKSVKRVLFIYFWQTKNILEKFFFLWGGAGFLWLYIIFFLHIFGGDFLNFLWFFWFFWFFFIFFLLFFFVLLDFFLQNYWCNY